MTILFRVRVPVLSEQSMSIPAISSIDARRVTIAPCFDKERDPIASVVVVTISTARGIDATRTTTANESASFTISLESLWNIIGNVAFVSLSVMIR